MKIDPHVAGATPAGLYDFSAEIKKGISGFENVGAAEIEQFHALGFLVVHNAIDPSTVVSARAALRELILRRDLDNIMIESQAAERFAMLPDEQRLHSVRKLMPVIGFDARLRAVAEDKALLQVMEGIIGETPALAQDMAMLKPPRIGREKPWHQDMAYFDYPSGTTIVAAWIALDEALPENGCMMIIPGTHREGPVPHWTRRDWQICDSDVQVGRSVAVPLPAGGCLLFHCLLHHGTPASRSHKTRWALQFHYRPASVTPFDDSSHRLGRFGTEGKDVTC